MSLGARVSRRRSALFCTQIVYILHLGFVLTQIYRLLHRQLHRILHSESGLGLVRTDRLYTRMRSLFT